MKVNSNSFKFLIYFKFLNHVFEIKFFKVFNISKFDFVIIYNLKDTWIAKIRIFNGL